MGFFNQELAKACQKVEMIVAGIATTIKDYTLEKSANGKGGEKITIITGYRCGDIPIKNAGSRTALYQQYTLMRANGESNPNPAKAFLRDLKSGSYQN